MTENNSPLERLLDWCAGQVASLRLSYQTPSTGEIDDEVRQEIEQVEADMRAVERDHRSLVDAYGAAAQELQRLGVKSVPLTLHQPGQDDQPESEPVFDHRGREVGRRLTDPRATTPEGMRQGLEEAKTRQADPTPPQWRDALEAFNRIMDRIPDSHFKGDAIMQMANDEQAVRRALAEPAVPDEVRRLPDQLRVRSRMASRNESAGERRGMRIAADELEEIIARHKKPAKVDIDKMNRELAQHSEPGRVPEVRSRFLYRDYWDTERSHRPYRGILHTTDDERAGVRLQSMVQESGAEDGEIIEISIHRTGERPFSNRIWALTAPHTYEPIDGNPEPDGENE